MGASLPGLGSTFCTYPATYAANSDIANATKQAATSTTTPPPVLTSKLSLPAADAVRIYANPYSNEVVVVNVGTSKGHESKLLAANDSVTAIIKNASNTALLNIPVTLTVTGVDPTVQNQNITSLAAGESDTLTFAGLTLTGSGQQDIKVSVPADQKNTNDSIIVSRIISCDTLGYSNNSVPYDGIGFNTGAGLMAARYKVPATFPIEVRAVNIGISTGTANTGNAVYGVVLNSQGVILAASAPVTLTSADLGQEKVFNFDTPVIIDADSTFYVGLAQSANTSTGYFPVATQYPVNNPTDRMFSFSISGGVGSVINGLGNLVIEAIITGHADISNSALNDTLCEGSPVSYAVTPGYTAYDFQVNGASAQNAASNIYDMPLTATSIVTANVSYNTCTASLNADTLTVIPTAVVSANITESANNICNGTPVTFTSVVTNEGSAPVYQWKVNGADVSTDTSYTYTPDDGDTVNCFLVSDVVCPSNDSAFSNDVFMDVNPILVPSVTISADPGTSLTNGQTVTFTATPVDGGITPVYQWRKNGADIPTEISDEYQAVAGTDIQDNDQISVLLISSEACADPDSANSTALTLDISTTTGIKV